MAPPRKPEHLKVLAGTTRKDRPPKPPEPPPEDIGEEFPDAENDATIDMELVLLPNPPAPVWLPNIHAKREWARLAPLLVKHKLLTVGGLSPLGMLCALHGKIVQLYSAGEAPPAAMLGTYRSLINDFGLTPASQGKVKRVDNLPHPNEKQGSSKEPEAPAAPAVVVNAFARNGRRTG